MNITKENTMDSGKPDYFIPVIDPYTGEDVANG